MDRWSSGPIAAHDVLQDLSLHGLRALVTGGASGLGLESALSLAEVGAEVTIGVRDVVRGREVAAQHAGRARLLVASLDLLDGGSIDTFCSGWDGPLHVLVNNAAVMACPESRTPRGWDLQLATNHLGHFRLAVGLRRALAAGAPSRIVCVSSSAHMRSPVVFDDLHFCFRRYDPWLAYGQSKTANVLFAVGASSRWCDDGVAVNALMPGVARTRLQRHLPDLREIQPDREMTVAQAAATTVFLAGHPDAHGVTGKYFFACREAVVVKKRTADGSGVAPFALDLANAERLWRVSEQHWAC